MARPSTASTDIRTLPKLGPRSIFLRRVSTSEEEEQQLKTRLAVHRYINRVFGKGLTHSEKEFLAALNDTGSFSLLLIIIYSFLLWFMSAVMLGSTILEEERFIVRCKIPALENCLNYSEILNISLINKAPTFQNSISKQYCRYDDRDYPQLVATYGCKYTAMLNAIQLKENIPSSKPCDDYVMLRETVSTLFKSEIPIHRSIREDLNLFCDKDVWNRIFVLVFAYGSAFSMLILTPTADIFGRKRMFVIESLVYVLSCMLLFLPCNACKVTGLFISGFGFCAFISLYVLCLELCSNATVLWFGLMIVILNSILYQVDFELRRNMVSWIYVHVATTSMLLLLPFGIWYITESPRWLMFTGNKAAAWEILKILESSNVPNDSNIRESDLERRPTTLIKILRFFHHAPFRERIITDIVLHFLTSISIYSTEEEKITGIHLGTTEYYVLSFGFQILTTTLAYLSAILYGRKKTCFILYCLLTACDALVFMEDSSSDNQILPLILYFRGSLKISVVYILYFYTAEMFPTPFRATALYICVASSLMGTVIQYHFYYPNPKSIKYMPPFIASIVCLLMVNFLPVTQNCGLPDTPRDALFFKTGR